jgi:hypothetical protein
MNRVKELVDCFFRYKKMYEESKDLMYLVFMENIARKVGGEFYSWWRRIVMDYAEWWGLCNVKVNSCEDVVRVAVVCWPNVGRELLRRCRSKELNYLFSGRYVC